jgi:hypothetical protein
MHITCVYGKIISYIKSESENSTVWLVNLFFFIITLYTRLYVRIDILLTCEWHLHDRIISQRGGIWIQKIRLIIPLIPHCLTSLSTIEKSIPLIPQCLTSLSTIEKSIPLIPHCLTSLSTSIIISRRTLSSSAVSITANVAPCAPHVLYKNITLLIIGLLYIKLTITSVNQRLWSLFLLIMSYHSMSL